MGGAESVDEQVATAIVVKLKIYVVPHVQATTLFDRSDKRGRLLAKARDPVVADRNDLFQMDSVRCRSLMAPLLVVLPSFS